MASDVDATENALDAAFERVLLESARDDAPAEGASRAAFARFAAVAGGTAAGAGAEVAGSALVRAVRRAGAQWFAIGAVSGSALTAAWMVTSTPSLGEGATPAAIASAPVTRAAHPARDPVPATVPSASRELARAPSAPMSARRSARSASSSVSPPPSRRASTLSAEIEALDRVRAALARRDFDRAFALTERYGREFPEGQLAADVAALGIEALAGQGNHAEAKRRATLFLTRYRNDPHRARVEALVEP
jgi:hypothetical protein